MHFKRRRSKRVVKCTSCTPHRWMGNHKERFDFKTTTQKKVAEEEIILDKLIVDKNE